MNGRSGSLKLEYAASQHVAGLKPECLRTLDFKEVNPEEARALPSGDVLSSYPIKVHVYSYFCSKVRIW